MRIGSLDVNGTERAWRAALLERFADRPDIGKAAAAEQFLGVGAGRKASLIDLMDLIEFHFSLPSGLLRPDDPIDKLTAPIKTRHPWRWAVFQVKMGDGILALSEEVEARAKREGRKIDWPTIRTIGQLADAWCG
ncbi:MAG: hypothetical protein NVS1B4_23240 [Gemmatimonadaceae bacterium]